jgi:hypothetical protein
MLINSLEGLAANGVSDAASHQAWCRSEAICLLRFP